MREGHNIRYVQFETNQGIGYGCFDMQWSRKDDKITYAIGTSFCNPKDHFVKSLARKISSGRLENNFQTGVVPSKETGFITDLDFVNILMDMFANGIENTTYPNWARKAFNRGMYFLTMRSNSIIDKNDLKAWRETFAAVKNDKDFKVIDIRSFPVPTGNCPDCGAVYMLGGGFGAHKRAGCTPKKNTL